MGFRHTGRGDPDEGGLGPHIRHRGAARVAHGRANATHQLLDNGRYWPLVRHTAFYSFGYQFFSANTGILEITIRRPLLLGHGTDGTHAPIGFVSPSLIQLYLTGRFLDGASRESLILEMEFQRFLATQDSLAGGTAYLFFNFQADRLERTVLSIQEFRAGTIDWREVNRRFCDNSFYDEINMNSFNFVNAAFDDLYGRYPTEAGFEQAYAAVEFGAPSLLFGEVIEDRFDFLDAMVGDPEFEEGAVRWLAEKLLVRPITGAEMAAWRTTAGPDVDIRPLLKLLISSDEYADFE